MCDRIYEKWSYACIQFSTLRICNSASIGPTASIFSSRTLICYHCTNRTEIFGLIACLQMKLCLFKVGKSDVCIRPL